MLPDVAPYQNKSERFLYEIYLSIYLNTIIYILN